MLYSFCFLFSFFFLLFFSFFKWNLLWQWQAAVKWHMSILIRTYPTFVCHRYKGSLYFFNLCSCFFFFSLFNLCAILMEIFKTLNWTKGDPINEKFWTKKKFFGRFFLTSLLSKKVRKCHEKLLSLLFRFVPTRSE